MIAERFRSDDPSKVLRKETEMATKTKAIEVKVVYVTFEEVVSA